MASTRELLKDPEFQRLPEGAKLRVIERFTAQDQEFQRLPAGAQSAVRQKLLGGGTPAPSTPAPAQEEEPGLLSRAGEGLFNLLELTTPSVSHDPKAARTGIEIAAGTLGSLLGGPGLGGAFAGAGASAGLSYLGSRASELFDPTQDPQQTALKSGLSAAVGDLGGSVLGGVARRIFPTRELIPGAEQANQLLETQGARLTPSQATESRVLDLAENVSEASMFGGGRIRSTKQQAQEAAEGLIRDFKQGIAGGGVPEQDLAQMVTDAIDDGALAFGQAARGKYQQVDQLTQGSGVDLSKVKDFFFNTALKNRKYEMEGPTMHRLERLMRRVEDTPTFEQAQTLRSGLLSVTRTGDDPVADKAVGVAKRLAGLVDQSMEDTAKTLGPDALQAWRGANEFWKHGKETFNNSFIKSLAHSDPDVVVDKILRNDRPVNLKRVKEIVGTDEWAGIKDAFLGKVIREATDTGDSISGTKLQAGLKRFGDDALSELLGPEGTQRAKQLARTLELTQGKSGDATGRTFIQLSQAGAVVGTLATGASLPAGAILIGPAILSKILTNPRMSRLLTMGLSPTAPTETKLRMGGRLAALLAKEGLLSEESDVPHASTP